MTGLEEVFVNCRGRLRGLAYRMLGSQADAEDILQDAYLRVKQADRTDIRNIEAFLFTTVTRLCLDQLKSARRRREVYVGPWLPEPVIDTESLSPETAAEVADDLSYALLMTLQKMSAPERAVFLLHDVFETPFAQIAETLGKSEAACRQLASRARKAVKGARPARPASAEAHKALLTNFAEAIATGDQSRLEAMLTADVVAYSDGGGVKIAALHPIVGTDKVARFFLGLVRKAHKLGNTAEFAMATINGAPGFLINVDGALDHTMSIDVDGDRIAAFYMVRNPEKLGAVGAALREGQPQAE